MINMQQHKHPFKSNWYKEKRNKVTRRFHYNLYRLFGLSRKQAIRINDWSYPHIIKFLKAYIIVKGDMDDKKRYE